MAEKPQVSRYVELARQRQSRMLALARNGHPKGYWYDADEADRAVRFFPTFLRHVKGEWAGRPYELEAWEADDIIRPLFGWKRADGTRLYRVAYMEKGRKNGKSTRAAGVGLFLTAGDQEPGAEVYSSATKKDQAKITWSVARQMVKQSEPLRRFVSENKSAIWCDRLASTFQPLGADSNTLDGLNVHGNIVDELHAHRDRGVWDVMMTGQGSRRQPLTFVITTAGLYDPTSIGWEQHEWARKVLEGDIEDDAYFAYIACADREDDWRDPATWPKANPNYGISVKHDYLEDLASRAENSPAFQNTFLRKHLCIWTEQLERWLDMNQWKACKEKVDWSAFNGRDCFGGVDLSSTRDIAALALLFPMDDGRLYARLFFWVPEDTAHDVTRRRIAPYDAWMMRGHLTATPGGVIDYDFIHVQVMELAKQYNIREIAYDPWNATQFAKGLEAEGFTMVQVRQGFATISEPSKALERAVVSRQFRQDNNPVLHWMASNVTKKEDPHGNIKPDKSTSTGKIDGISAICTALDGIVRGRGTKSPYEERGILTI